MPKRALVERRPWLLASLGTAIAVFALQDEAVPGAYLLVLKALPLFLLAVYALLRHNSSDARLLAGAMVMAGMGVATVDLFPQTGTTLLIVGHGFLIGLLLQHRREVMTASQKAAIVALLILTPLITWQLSSDRLMAATSAIYGLALGGMAASAWASSFSRYRVGAGALFCVLAGMVGVAASGPLGASNVSSQLPWPLFYLGYFLICVGIIQRLRSR